MNTERTTQDIVETWLVDGFESAPDVEQMLDDVRTVVVATPQRRHRWWPLPLPARVAAPVADIPSTELQPTPIAATNGREPTVTGRTMPMFSATKFVLAGVIVALLGSVLLIAQLFDQQGASVPGAATGGPGSFSPAGLLAEARSYHTATLLPDGRVLVIGGKTKDPDPEVILAEVWDPATASFAPAGSLTEGRSGHTATRLPDGRVLVVGGGHDGDHLSPASAEVWDPVTSSFSPAGSTAHGHEGHAATLLSDGRVLVVGGEGSVTAAEVWDPATRTFNPAGSTERVGSGRTATLLRDGRVLVVGGYSGDFEEVSAEVWDPATRTFAPAGSLSVGPTDGHTATLLSDGRVLVIGGQGFVGEGQGFEGSGHDDLALAAVWDPATASFEPAGLLGEGRSGHTATLLSDGRVLVVGGYSGDGSHPPVSEVWDPATASFSPAGSPAEPRTRHTATLLHDGRVLVVAGDFLGLASAEVWEPGDG